MTAPLLSEADAWQVAGLRDGAAFFQALSALLPDATHVFLEGTPAPEIAAIVASHAAEGEYVAPIGTIWSWPRERRLAVRASAVLFAQLADAAQRHAEPEICSHLHVYRGPEALAQWFDAFSDPLLVSKVVSRERVEQFCRATGGTLTDAGPPPVPGRVR